MNHIKFHTVLLAALLSSVSCQDRRHNYIDTNASNNNNFAAFGPEVNGVMTKISVDRLSNRNECVINCTIRSQTELLLNPNSAITNLTFSDSLGRMIRPISRVNVDPAADDINAFVHINGDNIVSMHLRIESKIIKFDLLEYPIPNNGDVVLQTRVSGGYFGNKKPVGDFWYGNATSNALTIHVP